MSRWGERNIARRVVAVDTWVSQELQPFEQLIVVDGAPAAVDSETGPDERVRWLGIAMLVALSLARRSTLFWYLLPALVPVVAAFVLTIRRHFYAVTDRRLLVQRVSVQRANPRGAVIGYPRRNARVVRVRTGSKRSRISVLTIAIAQPSGRQESLTLPIAEDVWPGRAQAIRHALEPGEASTG
jgi:hypothetical protein